MQARPATEKREMRESSWEVSLNASGAGFKMDSYCLCVWLVKS